MEAAFTEEFLKERKKLKEQKKKGFVADNYAIFDFMKIEDSKIADLKKKVDANDTYSIFFDGASENNPGKAGAGVVIFDGKNKEFFAEGFPLGLKTNNEAEYLGLIYGLKMASDVGIQKLEVFGDSMLVVKQLKGEWKVKAINLLKLNVEARRLKALFKEFQIEHVYREKNIYADKLSSDAAKLSKK
eukprot:TRINITY_DN2503_c0_g1_i5.p1 TRINITY_DN2503_c0_g1~~TRINITY_DN2503_c0_g1_i5.p1  ORF type:complete len:187 (+),score=36.40 TRINITY_DN2503_c0_g1_i5:132-692(+)